MTKRTEEVSSTTIDGILPPGADQAMLLATLYDEHAAVVLGFLEKIADQKEQAEELLQAVFLALPGRIHEFNPRKGRLTAWILNLAREVAGTAMNSGNQPTNNAIRNNPQIVSEPNARRLTPSVEKEKSVIELLYVKGYTFAQAARELGVEENNIRAMVRQELKKYRSTAGTMDRGRSNA